MSAVSTLASVQVQDSAAPPVASPDTARVLTFLVTNIGNGSETFRLSRSNAIEGDQYDPVSATGDGAIRFACSKRCAAFA